MYSASICAVTSSAATSASAWSSACFTSLRVATGVTFVTSNANSGVGGFGLPPRMGMIPPPSPPRNTKPSTTAATTITPPTMRYAGLMREDEDACRPSDKTPESVRAPSMSNNRTGVRNP